MLSYERYCEEMKKKGFTPIPESCFYKGTETPMELVRVKKGGRSVEPKFETWRKNEVRRGN